MVFIFALVVEESVWGLGAQLFENPATRMNDVHKIAGGDPVSGYVPVLGYCTSTATGTSAGTADRMCFKPMPEGATLPTGTPGQVPTVSATTATGTVTTTATQTTTGTATSGTYSFTATGTVTTTGTEIKMTNGTVDFDMAGVYFVGSEPSEGSDPGPGAASTGRWTRWRTVRDNGSLHYLTYAGTCSSGTDALIMTMTDNGSYWGGPAVYDEREIWPAGNWLASFRAKVNANSAAIRIEVWRDAYYGSEYDAQLFNWTTDSFANTDFAVVSKMAVQPEFVPLSTHDQVMFKLYATCSSSTTVTIDVGTKSNGWASRIYSPFAVDRLHASDIAYFGETDSVGGELFYLSNLLGGTIEDLATLDEQKEDVVHGTTGQFVKFIGTGADTTSKGGVTVSIPTPVTTRTFSISANDFNIGIGAVAGDVQSVAASWTLRDGQNDQIYGAVMNVPSDYASGLTVLPVWSPSATDGNSAHSVRWKLSYAVLATGTISFTDHNWNGTACGSNCTADYLIKEGASSAMTVIPGASYMLYFQRNHSSGLDTYAGDVRLIALRFSYTSSL